MFPLEWCTGIPQPGHPGAFGAVRKHSTHMGIDLYTREGEEVFPVEVGTVIAVEPFTGPHDGTPWWLDTWAVLVAGPSGVVCYGEIIPRADIAVGDLVDVFNVLGHVTPVIMEHRARPDIPGHSRAMLHLEWYTPDIASRVFSSAERCVVFKRNRWPCGTAQPAYILDPTARLQRSTVIPRLVMPPESAWACAATPEEGPDATDT
jgi:hypothetical protein